MHAHIARQIGLAVWSLNSSHHYWRLALNVLVYCLHLFTPFF
jgi:hypothetical protein